MHVCWTDPSSTEPLYEEVASDLLSAAGISGGLLAAPGELADLSGVGGDGVQTLKAGDGAGSQTSDRFNHVKRGPPTINGTRHRE